MIDGHEHATAATAALFAGMVLAHGEPTSRFVHDRRELVVRPQLIGVVAGWSLPEIDKATRRWAVEIARDDRDAHGIERMAS